MANSTGIMIVVGVVALGLLIYLLFFHKADPEKQNKKIKTKISRLKSSMQLTDKEIKEKKDKLINDVKLSDKEKESIKNKLKNDYFKDINNSDKFFSEAKPYNPIKTNKSKLEFKYWKDYFLDKFMPNKTTLIHMELLNGMHTQFMIVVSADNSFRYKGKKYVLDNELKYFDLNAKLWAFDFHEDFTLPIRRKISLSTIKKTLEVSNISEVEYMTNPSTLERFTISKIAEGIMKGQQIDEFFKKINVFLLVTMIIVIVHFVLFVYGSGMLNNLQIPGFT